MIRRAETGRLQRGQAMTKHPTFVDLSHVVEDGMVTYPGLPGPVIADFVSRDQSEVDYAFGVQFHIGRIEMVANTGTYIDSPFHRYTAGADLAGLPLDAIAGVSGLAVRAAYRGDRGIGGEIFHRLDVRDRAVLIHTGWDRYWGTPKYFEGYPYLTSDAAGYLVEAGARLVGIDSLNIDDHQDGHRPVHSALLQAGIPIVEHLCNLDELPDDNFEFFAVPAMVRGMGSFPVRAFARLTPHRDVPWPVTRMGKVLLRPHT